MADSPDPFFVGIPNANQIRRELLLSSKEVLTALKSHEALKDLRRTKIECYFELRTVMEELLILNRKLRGSLPKTSLKPAMPKPRPRHAIGHHEAHHKKRMFHPRQQRTAPPVHHKDQVEKLIYGFQTPASHVFVLFLSFKMSTLHSRQH